MTLVPRAATLALLAVLAMLLSGAAPVFAQAPGSDEAPRIEPLPDPDDGLSGVSTLRFISPRARIALPEPMPGPVLRFVIADDFPPFAYIDGAGRLAGVHIDLVRRLCATLALACTVQTRRFDQVLAAVDEDPQNLVLVAGLAVSEPLAEDLTFSLPYFRFPGRFVGLRAADDGEGWVDRARIGVIEGSAHQRFLAEAYGDAAVEAFADSPAMLRALRRGDVSHVFGDGVDLAFWLAGTQSGECCRFIGAPLFSRAHFGEGLALAVPRGQPALLQALNAGLARLESAGDMERVILTAFPLDPLGE